MHIATKLAGYPWRTFSSRQWVDACRASLDRMGLEKISMAQLHWSTANYQPVQERVMWDGLVAMYDAGLADLPLLLPPRTVGCVRPPRTVVPSTGGQVSRSTSYGRGTMPSMVEVL